MFNVFEAAITFPVSYALGAAAVKCLLHIEILCLCVAHCDSKRQELCVDFLSGD